VGAVVKVESASPNGVLDEQRVVETMNKTLIISFVGVLATPPVAATATTFIAGEIHRTTAEPSAAVRDAQHRTELRITVWYPAAGGAAARPVVIGPPQQPTFQVGSAATNAPFVADPAGRLRPVILLSHGFGGTAEVMGWFGMAMAEDGYIVISVDHPGNNAVDQMTVPGAILWWERAEDLKRAIEAVSHDRIIGPHVDLARVGAAGFSAGGFTALVLGGARADPEHLQRFCHEHPDDGVCRPQVEFTVTETEAERSRQDPQVAALEAKAHDDHSLGSVKAVFAMAPALIQGLDPESLRALRRPVTMVAGDADTVAPPATNAQVGARLIPGARLEMVPHVGHYAFLSTCTPNLAASIRVCALAGPQDQAHHLAIEQAKELFARYLGAP
jgi:predicted dienelactone hydrolase